MVQPTDQIAELRGAVRFPLHLPVELKADGEQIQAETDNISAGGMLFHIDADLSIGSTLEFTIAMPADVLGAPTDVLVSGTGRVVRCNAEGEKKAVAAVIDEYRFQRS
ncbi:MAG TPA: PilZ domain-containing protein [Terriglobales bacterium]|nr:PilZ domain-containing protein [Terriglobales bacterium]